MYYVYVLHSAKRNILYRGFTEDLKSRFVQHNSGKVFSTRVGTPWKLVWYSAFTNKTDARREELFLKSGKGKDRIRHLLRETLALK